MPDQKRSDPFKPAQPQIPGVAAKAAEAQAAPSSSPADFEQPPPRKSGRWIAGTVGGILILGALFGWWSHASSSSNSASLQGGALAAPAAEPAANNTQHAENLPVGPGEIATTGELSKPWAAKRFLFRNPLTSETVPAMVVHLPGGEYWGFSLREPYGKCDMELVTDMQKLRADYNFSADHPMVGDPCSRSVFDLTHYGTAPSGLVRGEIEKGTAIRPPVAIEIRTRGDQVLAVRME